MSRVAVAQLVRLSSLIREERGSNLAAAARLGGTRAMFLLDSTRLDYKVYPGGKKLPSISELKLGF